MAQDHALSSTEDADHAHNDADQHLPSIAACFLVRFDQRVGYSIAWKRATPGLELDGVIEYKSLPSGLHNVKEDLIYFLYDRYAGLSSFMQQPSSEAERHAAFLAVGILLPLGSGRFAKGWLHAPELHKLTKTMIRDPEDTSALEAYWRKHGQTDAERSGSEGSSDTLASTAASRGHDISAAHPVFFATRLLDEFGPLIFPLYRAALLRQRIILVSKPPLERPCAFVYILSLLAAIPPSIAEHLPEPSFARILPLFTVGIHDMSMLETDAARARQLHPISSSAETDETTQQTRGWIACSSDEVLLTKDSLSDVRVRLQANDNNSSAVNTWPLITGNNVAGMKATPRDLRRYRALRQGLKYLGEERDDDVQNQGNEQAPLLSINDPELITVEVPNETTIVEPQPWAAILYDSFLWWASAGERSVHQQEEFDHDADLIFTAADVWDDAEAYSRRYSGPILPGALSDSSGALEMAIIAYFHRMTTTIIGILSQVVELAEEVEDDGDSRERDNVLFITKDEMVSMGLDPWSKGDREWVAQMIEVYFDRKATVQGVSVECCGVRLY